ncbi:hypothetical protein ASJ30_04060 [Janibacter indicus]|uniref:Uncharacterized protein n=1 Tax=Janibacter indicus TaxID=857417 RepID=A0A1L3MEM0_9MICO|nr:hypothetical protein ASJ30_04060 [Janibacter indicus]
MGAKVLGAVLNQASTKKVDRIRYGDVEYGDVTSYEKEYVAEADGAQSSGHQGRAARTRLTGTTVVSAWRRGRGG